MDRRPLFLFLALVQTICSLASGQPTDTPEAPVMTPDTPATAPATTVSIDQTTPRGTLKMLSIAIEAGDTRSVRRVMHTETPAEQSVVDALAARTESLVTLRKAATEQFGEEGAIAMLGDMKAQLDQSQRMIDQASEQITGEQAIVDPVGAGDPSDLVHLVRVDGQWKIAVSEMAAGLSPQELKQRASDAELFGRVSDEMAGEIAKGKFESPETARRELETRLRKALEEQQRSRRERHPNSPPHDPPPSTK